MSPRDVSFTCPKLVFLIKKRNENNHLGVICFYVYLPIIRNKTGLEDFMRFDYFVFEEFEDQLARLKF